MTPEELLRDEARRWLAVAERDLRVARLLAGGEPATSVFHSQQAAEKAAKALLALHGVAFRKTHDIQELGAQCAAIDPELASLLADSDFLTDYAVVFRYLDAPREPDSAEAETGAATAAAIVERVRGLLNL